ncbi:MAG: sulfotransferase [Pseudomonadales bacterium]
MAQPAVIFILSTNYSGSHLLAQLLAAHSRCASVGELHNYRKFTRRISRSGNVAHDYLSSSLFAGLDSLPENTWHRTIFERLQLRDPQASHLIDNSKRVQWVRAVQASCASHVLLLRDPRALVSRWLRTYSGPRQEQRQRRRLLRRRPWWLGRLDDPVDLYLHKWLLANTRLRRFVAGSPSAATLTYRDLVVRTEPTLTDLMPRLGLAFEPGQLRYGTAGTVLGTRKRDYVQHAARSEIVPDLRWQHDLTPAQQARIVGNRALRHFLAQDRLRMVEDGLTRHL